MGRPGERGGARWKALAAAGVVAGCGGPVAGPGYGGTDLAPPPSCLETPKPTVLAKLRPDVERDGARHVEILVVFEQADTAVGKLQASAAGAPLEITEQAVHAHDFRLVVRAPKDTTTVRVDAEVDCSSRGAGFAMTLELDAAGVKVVGIR